MNQPLTAAQDKGDAQTDYEAVRLWLASFEAALKAGNEKALAAHFAADGHSRDLLAFTWSITPRQGADAIAALLLQKQGRAGAGNITHAALVDCFSLPAKFAKDVAGVAPMAARSATALGLAS